MIHGIEQIQVKILALHCCLYQKFMQFTFLAIAVQWRPCLLIIHAAILRIYALVFFLGFFSQKNEYRFIDFQ